MNFDRVMEFITDPEEAGKLMPTVHPEYKAKVFEWTNYAVQILMCSNYRDAEQIIEKRNSARSTYQEMLDDMVDKGTVTNGDIVLTSFAQGLSIGIDKAFDRMRSAVLSDVAGEIPTMSTNDDGKETVTVRLLDADAIVNMLINKVLNGKD